MLKEIAVLFLRLGSTAFGGPAAHIAMMEDEIVKRRQWITREHFLDLLGATNLMPGPNSTEMAIHIGYVKGGWRGLVIAGACFILPAIAITLLLAHLYVLFGTLPQAGRLMWGIRASIIAVVLGAVVRLGRPMTRKLPMMTLGLAVIVLNFLHVDEIVLLLAAGAAGLLWSIRHRIAADSLRLWLHLPVIFLMPLGLTTSSSSQGAATLTGLGLFFLKIGSILYGSGYVLVAFLHGGLVDVHHWLSQTQLLDAIAVGQFTPGPVLSTATFIGYVILGVPGALVSTLGIFLPSFLFVLITGPIIPRLRKSPLASGFLDGVNAASLGLMTAVCITLGMSTFTSPGAWIIFALSAAILLRWNPNPVWIVVGSAAAGWIITLYQ